MRSVKAYQQKMIIPTYELGKSETNPVFFEKRVYQGSSGKVYPVPFIDKVYDYKVEKNYDAAIMENDFVRLVLLPEIGGRIFEAQDKTNDNYDFFYKQKVIKPALVGLAGPWISGGVEFNWPQHHRPGTYLPTDVYIEEEASGAKTVWMSEYDPMYRLKGMHGIRIFPDSSLIELRARLFNRTPLTQTFLWWANVATDAHDQYQSFFPPDVHYVADHAVRAISSFPEAENYYYGIPYHERKGKNDLRIYNNITVPTSYMVCDTKFDFFGGYDFIKKGGFVHVANRHIAPGKKQWTWGNDEFGRAWDRELTDEGGPYLELMAGVYTDNQPDFTYLLPYETKTFSQFWWSYKELGPVQNANKDMAIKLEILAGNRLDLGVAACKQFEQLKFILEVGGEKKIFENMSVSPCSPWKNSSIKIDSGQENNLSLSVVDHKGKVIISYHKRESQKERNRNVAFEPKQPEDINSSIELDLIGEHLELYRHPTRYPEAYWETALERDPKNYKAHIGLGKIKLKNGEFSKAETEFSSAIRILTTYHPNPITGEAHYFCGLSVKYQNRKEEAYGLFYKATWNYEWRSASYYQLSCLDCLQNNFETALEHLELSLDTNRQNNKAHILKAIILRYSDQNENALSVLERLLEIDPLDQWAKLEMAHLKGNYSEFLSGSRNDAQTILDITFDYAEAGFYQEAIHVLELHRQNDVIKSAVPNPMKQSLMTTFTLAWLYHLKDDIEKSENLLEETKEGSYDYLFPSRICEQVVLNWVLEVDKNNARAAYGLGNFLFNVKRHEEAIKVWELAAASSCKYGTLYRNLGIAYWNTSKEGKKARSAFMKAIDHAPDDLRIRYEFDQLRKKLNDDPKDRLKDLIAIKELVAYRDDFSVELAALYNINGEYEKALDFLESRNFHPWEGGEGMVLKQYTHACLKLGQKALEEKNPEVALNYFEKSLNTPDNLGEKYHPLQAVAHINFWKGKALQAMGKMELANERFEESMNEQGDFIDMAVSAVSELTYYKALSMKELGREKDAEQLLDDLLKHGQEQLKEEAQIDYFATSLPLLLVFEDDIQKRSDIDARFLMALAYLGKQDDAKGIEQLEKILALNSMHLGANELKKSYAQRLMA